MIVGDSVAFYLGPSMQGLHTTPPLAVFDAGYAGCNTLPEVTSDRSRRGTGQVVVDATYPCNPAWEATALQRFDPDVVIWVASSPPDELREGTQWLSACGSQYAADFRSALSHEVEMLGAHGARVVITTSAYPRFPLHGSDAAAECQNPLRRQVAKSTGAQLVDLFSYICPNGKCRVKQNGVTLRSDGLHYKGPGGAIVAQWLYDQITRSR
jgi:hypothetical protein